jgi:hypothetical protein
VIHQKGVTKSEIARRLSIAHDAFAQHRRLLYKNSKLPWQKRVELFQALIFSKLAYGLETWTFACQRSRTQFHAGVMRLYRHDAHLRDEDILHHTGLPLPSELLRRACLRYLGTLCQAGHSMCWCLINEDASWLWAQLSNTSDRGNPVEHFAAWEEMI